jgi:hypothetical protein
VNIATINFNGSTSVMTLHNAEVLADFVKKHNIHILSLVDHRSTNEQLRGITSIISRYTESDTHLAAASENISTSTNRHERVGGTAIILIGKLAHAHVTTFTLDKSETNFITSAIIKYEKDLAPPLIVHSIYMFPTANSTTGPTTANTRLHNYISTIKPLRPPTTQQWMHDLIAEQISQLDPDNSAIHIIAGDLNHVKWHDQQNLKLIYFSID